MASRAPESSGHTWTLHSCGVSLPRSHAHFHTPFFFWGINFIESECTEVQQHKEICSVSNPEWYFKIYYKGKNLSLVEKLLIFLKGSLLLYVLRNLLFHTKALPLSYCVHVLLGLVLRISVRVPLQWLEPRRSCWEWSSNGWTPAAFWPGHSSSFWFRQQSQRCWQQTAQLWGWTCPFFHFFLK